MLLPASGLKQIRISRFQAPPGVQFQDRTIPDDREEVEILVCGAGWFDVEGAPTLATTGSMLWFQPGEVIRAKSDPTEPYVCVVFTFPTPAAPLPLAVPARLTRWADAAEAVRFATEALERFHLQMPDLPLFWLYHESRMRWEAAEYQRHRTLITDALSISLERALAYIAAHFKEALPIARLAHAAGISSTRLYDLFRRRFNETPLQRITRMRILHACDLLTATRLSVKEIGPASGFNDPVHFCRVFRQSQGLSPGAYRKQFARSATRP